jgi:hypothetical protein
MYEYRGRISLSRIPVHLFDHLDRHLSATANDDSLPVATALLRQGKSNVTYPVNEHTPFLDKIRQIAIALPI